MSDLLYEVTDHVGVITLNRPEAMNSLTYQLYADLEDTVRTSEARVLVITGSGRAFCAGNDLKVIAGAGKEEDKFMDLTFPVRSLCEQRDFTS